jgi:phosphoadenosine phosphosulfate reductase
MSKLGKFLMGKRLEMKLSRQQVVELMPQQVRIDVSTYANIEKGNIKRPPEKRLMAFADIFKVSLKVLHQLLLSTSVVLLTSCVLSNSQREMTSIKLIQEFEPAEGYHVAFSGGKDSIVMYDLVKRSFVKHQAYFALTTVDPLTLVHFIKREYPEVRILKPATSMFKLIAAEKKILPIRQRRYCCKHLKEYAGKGEFVITGVRWEESNARAKRKHFEIDTRPEMLGKMYLNPILEWTEGDIWHYIKNKGLKYSELYDQGYGRIGCIGCPMVGEEWRRKEFELYPRYKQMYLKAIRIAREDHSKSIYYNFKDEYDVFNWWLSDFPVREWMSIRDDQLKLFTEEDYL